MRVLLIAYAYPPCGASAVYPTVQVVKYLAQQGHDVRVLTVREGYHYCVVTEDPHTLANGVPVSRTAVWSPLRTWERVTAQRANSPSAPGGGDGAGETARRRLRGGLRAALVELMTTPDAEAGWVLPAVVRARSMMARERFDIIYTVAPMRSTHLIGLALRIAGGPPWAADFHDPWLADISPTHRTRLAREIHLRLGRLVVDRADLVIGRTPGIVRGLMAGREGSRRPRCLVVPCGYDPEEVEAARPLAEGLRSPKRFVVTHTGAFYGRRNPLPLLRALAGAAQAGRLPAGLLVRFVGRWDDGWLALAQPWLDPLRRRGLVELIGQVNHLQSIAYVLASDALLLVQLEAPDQVPAKAYEYLATGRPLLALTDAGATAELAVAAGGTVVSPGNEAGLAEVLGTMALAVRSGRAAGPPAGFAEQFAAPAVVARIAEELEATIAQRTGGLAAK